MDIHQSDMWLILGCKSTIYTYMRISQHIHIYEIVYHIYIYENNFTIYKN